MSARPAAPLLERELEGHRHELHGYCYRMLGSPFDADDAVQETLVRAWRSHEGFERRASLRTWLYRIASNVCLDMLRARSRRARPMDLAGPGSVETFRGEQLPEASWLLPVPDAAVLGDTADPAAVAEARETLRLAVLAALQHLPPRQRAALLLCEVLRFEAREVAELLETSVASVTSALQRARATLATVEAAPAAPPLAAQQELLARYVDAFQRYDMAALTALIHEDASQSMPPYSMWLKGREEILRFWQGPGAPCRGSRLIATAANGRAAFGQYRPSGPGGSHRPWALQVLELGDGGIVEMTFFLDVERLFPAFGLPLALD